MALEWTFKDIFNALSTNTVVVLSACAAACFGEMPCLAHPQHEARTDDDCHPILQREAHYVEEVLQNRSLNHQHLSCEYYHNDGEQSLASAEVERRTSRLEGACVEQIEEVGHDKYGEQQRQFVCREVSFGPER